MLTESNTGTKCDETSNITWRAETCVKDSRARLHHHWEPSSICCHQKACLTSYMFFENND